MIQNPKDKLICPHCGVTQTDRCEDYHVCGAVGEESQCADVCDDCEGKIFIERISENEVKVDKI